MLYSGACYVNTMREMPDPDRPIPNLFAAGMLGQPAPMGYH